MSKELEEHRHEHRARLRRLRRLLRPLPRRANIARYPIIKWFANAARSRPYLWSFRRAHVIPALYVGTVLAMLPLYGIQLPLAFLAALLLRGNLTVMAAIQFISNPLTVAPLYYANYVVGAWVMDTTGVATGHDGVTTKFQEMASGGAAMFIGGTILGLALAVVVDLLWRFAVWEANRFKARMERLRREAAGLPPEPEP
jgi:uncharacterized protein